MPATFVSCLFEAPCQLEYFFPALNAPQWVIVCVCECSSLFRFFFQFCPDFFCSTRTRLFIFKCDLPVKPKSMERGVPPLGKMLYTLASSRWQCSSKVPVDGRQKLPKMCARALPWSNSHCSSQSVQMFANEPNGWRSGQRGAAWPGESRRQLGWCRPHEPWQHSKWNNCSWKTGWLKVFLWLSL